MLLPAWLQNLSKKLIKSFDLHLTSSYVVGGYDVRWLIILHLSETLYRLCEVAIKDCKECTVEIVENVEHLLWFTQALLFLDSA